MGQFAGRNYRLLAAWFILVGAGSVVLSSLVPSLFQHFVVKPTELQLEKQYIDRNIALTRQAYNLEGSQPSRLPPNRG